MFIVWGKKSRQPKVTLGLTGPTATPRDESGPLPGQVLVPALGFTLPTKSSGARPVKVFSFANKVGSITDWMFAFCSFTLCSRRVVHSWTAEVCAALGRKSRVVLCHRYLSERRVSPRYCFHLSDNVTITTVFAGQISRLCLRCVKVST